MKAFSLKLDIGMRLVPSACMSAGCRTKEAWGTRLIRVADNSSVVCDIRRQYLGGMGLRYVGNEGRYLLLVFERDVGPVVGSLASNLFASMEEGKMGIGRLAAGVDMLVIGKEDVVDEET